MFYIRIVSLLLLTCFAFGCDYNPTPIVEDADDVDDLPDSTQHIRARGLGDEDIYSLERLKILSVVDFEGGWGVKEAEITDKGIEKLSSYDLPLLGILHLSRCKHITDEGLKYVSRMKSLHLLTLDFNDQITDKGLEYISEMSELDELRIRDCDGITDKGLRHLHKMKSLEEVHIGLIDNLSKEAIDELKKALPDCKVNTKPPYNPADHE